MPELPDITIYIEALEKRTLGQKLERVQLNSPFLLRTASPPLSSVFNKNVRELRRLGKRICIGMDDDLWLVLHLMIAGRLHWKAVTRPTAKTLISSKFKSQLATFQFGNGVLSLPEAGTQRRASLHVVAGEAGLRELDPGGIELFRTQDSTEGLGEFIELKSFANVLQSENHTLKRALTDPRLFSGVGNAYSDEILWAAHLSPVKLTQKLSDEEIKRLHEARRRATL